MACNLTRGRKEPCKDVVGGIKGVYFFDFGSITAAFDGTDTDVIDDLGTVTCFNYEVKVTVALNKLLQVLGKMVQLFLSKH